MYPILKALGVLVILMEIRYPVKTLHSVGHKTEYKECNGTSNLNREIEIVITEFRVLYETSNKKSFFDISDN